MKVKVFSIGSSKGFGAIEAEINSWLSANQKINLKYINLGVLPGRSGIGENDSIMILVFYEEERMFAEAE